MNRAIVLYPFGEQALHVPGVRSTRQDVGLEDSGFLTSGCLGFGARTKELTTLRRDL